MTHMYWPHPFFTLYILSNKHESRSQPFLRPYVIAQHEADTICDLKQKIDVRHGGAHL